MATYYHFPSQLNFEALGNFKTPVTDEHLRHGVAQDCEKCPVALALMDGFEAQADAIGDRLSVEVFEDNVILYPSTNRAGRVEALQIEMTGVLQEYIDNFDGRIAVPKGTLYIEKSTHDRDGNRLEEPHNDYELGIQLPDSYFLR